MKIRCLVVLFVLIAGCSSTPKKDFRNPPYEPKTPVQKAMQWMPISQKAGAEWGLDPKFITAIIAVESGGNPTVVSKSNAVGLMQLKASTAGREVYRYMGKSGAPSTSELKDPERNISMGAAYFSILEHGILAGIKDPGVMQYALTIAYVNGAGAMLRMFSSDREKAISRINGLNKDEFFAYIVKNHPASQAPRYIWKVQKAMDEIGNTSKNYPHDDLQEFISVLD